MKIIKIITFAFLICLINSCYKIQEYPIIFHDSYGSQLYLFEDSTFRYEMPSLLGYINEKWECKRKFFFLHQLTLYNSIAPDTIKNNINIRNSKSNINDSCIIYVNYIHTELILKGDKKDTILTQTNPFLRYFVVLKNDGYNKCQIREKIHSRVRTSKAFDIQLTDTLIIHYQDELHLACIFREKKVFVNFRTHKLRGSITNSGKVP
jgi:hypothetical protein